MERSDRATIATFFVASPFVVGESATLGEAEAHHIRVRRIDAGVRVALRNGEGGVARGRLVRLAKSSAVIEVEECSLVEPQAPVHLLVPIADRDRMLWLGEKAVELGAASWRPVMFRRSRSVGGRGEGAGFQARLRSRMEGALTQSGGAWLPLLHPDAALDRALHAAPEGCRLLLDGDGTPVAGASVRPPVVVLVGPEGGLEDDERERVVNAGFLPVSLGANVLRFETAGVAALAVVRALLDASSVTGATADE